MKVQLSEVWALDVHFSILIDHTRPTDQGVGLWVLSAMVERPLLSWLIMLVACFLYMTSVAGARCVMVVLCAELVSCVQGR